MNKIFTLLLFTLVFKSGFGQNTSSPQTYTITFDLISDSFDLSGKTKIGSLSGHSVNTGKFNLSHLFRSFWNDANKQGANSFTVDKVTQNGEGTTIEISIYSLTEAELKANRDKYPRNMIYIFGNMNGRKSSKEIIINDRQIELKPLEYFSYENQVDEQTIVKIGGHRGGKMRITGKEGRQPVYISLNGSGRSGISYAHTGTMSVNTGKINQVDFSLGAFLVKVLPEKQ